MSPWFNTSQQSSMGVTVCQKAVLGVLGVLGLSQHLPNMVYVAELGIGLLSFQVARSASEASRSANRSSWLSWLSWPTNRTPFSELFTP
jgi:hypothetical protein